MPGLKVDVLLGTDPLGARDRAVELARAGVNGLFSFENAHDVFFPLVLAAGAADVDLMTNVAIAFPRSPFHLAQQAYDLQLLSSGRFRLGLGTQIKVHIERRYGSTWTRPVARMRETVLAVKAILGSWQEGSRLDFRGEFTTHTLMPPAFNPGPNPLGAPPVLVGALGPKMTEMAAEVADGILIMPFNSARHLTERTRPAIERGLAAGHRPADELEVVGEVIVATGRGADELEAACRGVRWLLAFYGSTPAYRPVLDVEGRGELQPRLNAMSKRGEWAAMAELIDESMLRALAVVGTPEDCATQISARFGDLASRVCCYFPGYPIADERIAELVAALRAS